jgi:hypothetical protein
MLTAISIAGLATVVVGFGAFSLRQMADWHRLLDTHADIQLPVRVGPQSSG